MAFDTIRESVSIVPIRKPPKLTTSIPYEENPKAGAICRVAGWGSTRPALTVEDLNGPIFPSGKLQETEVRIWSYDKCVQTYENARS